LQRIFIIFILLAQLNISFGQSRPDTKIISYIAYKKPLGILLKDLASLSKVNLSYSESRLPIDAPISISAQNETLGSILTVVLDDFDLSYQLVGNQLVIVKNQSKNVTGEVRIYGHIRDKISGEYLIGANVFQHDKMRGTSSNESGNYSLKIDKQHHRLHFSYLGYKSEIIDIYALKDTEINISLQPDGLLNEIVIMDDLIEEEHEQAANQQSLHIDKIRSSNHLGGEADLFRYVATQPGITTAAEGVGGINVRGGSADQNLVLLDDVPVYNSGHALGIFSVFNSNTIKSISLYKGGIPARYAGRLSSVVDVHTRDGNFNKLSGDISLNTIALSGTVEGPIIKDRGSFLVSYRRTFMDIWIKEFTKFQNEEKNRTGSSNYFFSDFNAKINFRLNNKTRLLLQTLHSSDNFDSFSGAKPEEFRDETSTIINWGNSLYSLRLHRKWTNSVYSRTVLYWTGYNFESFKNKLFELEGNPNPLIFDASLYESDIAETGFKHEFDWMLSNVHTIKAGINMQDRTFNPLAINVSENDFTSLFPGPSINVLKSLKSRPIIKGQEINVFAEDDIVLGDGVSLNLGVNYSIVKSGSGKNYNAIQPRLAMLANSENLHFKVGMAKMQQYMHLLSNNGLGLPSDVWLQASKILEPQQSWLFNSSFGYRLNNGLKLGADVYYKTFKNISSYKEGGGIDISIGNDWETEIPIGEGYAYGFETYIEKVFGATLFNFNYTYSVSDRIFHDLNNGIQFPYNLNRNHSFKASFTYRISQFSEFLINWSYLSGNFYSKPLNITFDHEQRPVVIFPEKNNALFQPFHRLDIGFGFYNNYKWGRAKFFLGLYNAYNKNNPFYTDLVRDNNNNGKFEFRQFSLLPVLPTISYSVSF
jgi:CarboxypepD_reg-like domain/TonB-dependent Receptor Plug Domain